ncbi:MAG: universal stress protein [Actinomycetia bacterium]|nr:universal stress protein [Actinomycetes bacterium]
MLEKVVVGIDGSDASEAVAQWCRKALSGSEAQVVAVSCHTYRPELGDAANGQLRAELAIGTAGFCKLLSDTGIGCTSRVVDGDPRVALQEVAADEEADMLVVGSRGRSQLSDLMLGSVASYLTHHSPVSILVVR